jgi:hypothetical protein
MPDPRQALVYDEARYLLEQQQSILDGLRSRAGAVFATSSVSTSFLAGLTLKNSGLDEVAWSAIGCFLTVGLLSVAVLWPWYGWIFSLSPRILLVDYVEADPPASLEEMHRDLALYAEAHYDFNQVRLQRLVWAFQAAVGLLVLEVVLWVIELAVRG